MNKILLILTLFILIKPNLVQAQNKPASTSAAIETVVSVSSSAATVASPAAETIQKIQEKTESDITQPTQKQKSKLASYLEENPPGQLSWNNFIRYAISFAVTEGVPPNIIVLVLLFPLIASLIAASRHIIGLRGFGIYIPAVLSVALVSTGVFEGVALFLAIALSAVLTNRFLRKIKISYLPRTALMLWTISLGILILLIVAPIFNLTNLMSVNIFPILILVLLSENFLDAQSRTKQSDAFALTAETLGLAIISGLIIKWESLQKFALIQPELLILSIAAINIIVGKFTGLRFSEWLRFRSIIEEEE
jgi:hypothetical protein